MNIIDREIYFLYKRSVIIILGDHFCTRVTYHSLIRRYLLDQDLRRSIVSIERRYIETNLRWLKTQALRSNNNKAYIVFYIVLENLQQRIYNLSIGNQLATYFKIIFCEHTYRIIL